MDLEKLKPFIGTVLGQIKDADQLESEDNHQAILDNLPEITEILNAITLTQEDGFQWSDCFEIGKVVGPAMELAGRFKDMEGEAKRQFVIDVLWLAYKTVDGYPTGKKNNINIPFLIGNAEVKVEKAIVRLAANWAINAAYGPLQEAGKL